MTDFCNVGVEPSADPALQARLFSYPDAHRHRVGSNYQQLPVNIPNTPYLMANFQRDGPMALLNQGSLPNHLSSIEPIAFKSRRYTLDNIHSNFISKAVSFLREIRPEDFVQPRALWERVLDGSGRDRFVTNVAAHMDTCREEEIIKRQIAISRELSNDLATRLENALGAKGYDGIKDMAFNECHNGMGSKDNAVRVANGMSADINIPASNGTCLL